MFKLLFSLSLIALMGCSSNPHKAKEIETKMETQEQVTNESIGVKDGNMIVQKKVMMAEELRRLQYDVYELEDRVYGNRKYGSQGLFGTLKECRTKLSDKANGGDGKLTYMPPMDRITDKEDKFDIGTNAEKKIIGVQEEFLKDRISRFNGYKDILMKREDEFQEKIDICKAELKSKQFDKGTKDSSANN
ncbi:MAG: hypothetical protein A4S09_16815 [Proteobacteria bacterium SG_bin7]|nr:MAG: hypothetical protein A4S09_16815 [Proteobacteria bacterium SG_bin7]